MADVKRRDIIDDVVRETGLSKSDVNKVLSAAFEKLVYDLSVEKSINIPGFGTFDVVNKKARRGRNPSTGEKMDIPAKKAARFKPGSVLKKAVDTGTVPWADDD